MNSRHIYTIKEFCAVYRIGELRAREAIRRGDIIAVQIGGVCRIPDPGWDVMKRYQEYCLSHEHFISSAEARWFLDITSHNLHKIIEREQLHPRRPPNKKQGMLFSLIDILQCAQYREDYRKTNPSGYGKPATHKKPLRKSVLLWGKREAKRLGVLVALGPQLPPGAV